jgi:cap1 methyltransferase
MRGNARSMRRMTALHIVDAAFLGGEDIRKLNYKDRLQQCKIFAKAINKPSLPDYTIVRAKEVFGLDSIEEVFSLQSLKLQSKRLMTILFSPRL